MKKTGAVVEGNATAADSIYTEDEWMMGNVSGGHSRVFVLVDVDTCIDGTAEQVFHQTPQVSCSHRAVQVANEDGLLRVELLRRSTSKHERR